jgi:type III restriction enzyme
LVLVQLPDSKAGDAKQETVVNYLLEKGISTENGLLAIWLSNEKINLEGIRDMDSPIQFLLFKQAVATGWDCPRAQVLVMFRDIRSEPFKIQTVGRILRMPEQKHYLKEDLNRGYVYTNIYPLSVEEEAGEPTGILQNITVRKRAGLENVSLVSYYRQRADYNDLTTSFYA